MRWKDGGINYSQGTHLFVSSDTLACKYDTEEEVCGLGYKRQTPGTCFSQAIAKINTTGFSPSYPVCTSDYSPRLQSDVEVLLDSQRSTATGYIYSFGDVDGYIYELLRSASIEYSEWIISKSYTKSDIFALYASSTEEYSTYNEYLDLDYKIGTFLNVQLSSGLERRVRDSVSTLFSLDVFGSVSIIHPDYYAFSQTTSYTAVGVGSQNATYSTVASGIGTADGTINTTTSGDNPVEICAGDLEPPYLSSISPASGTHLVATSSAVSFEIGDEIGGVDKSSLYITVSGNLVTRPEGTSLVVAGVPQDASVSLTGTPSKYTFNYTPTVAWANNEIVTVTVTGTDTTPEVDGSPFLCTGQSVNQFGEEWAFYVEDHKDLGASVTGTPDVEPPYLDSVVPAKWSGNNPHDQDISFYIKDKHTGVDGDTVSIYINGEEVVREGTSVYHNASLTSVSNGYYFYYQNNGFDFGSRVVVRVVAYDSYDTPNLLDESYYYDVIPSSTLTVENFSPGVGINYNPESISVCIDVYDTTYGVSTNGINILINSESCSPNYTNIYGNRDLTSVSGSETLYGVTISGTELYNATLVGIDIVGSAFSGGYISSANSYGGGMYDFPSPYGATSSGYIVSASCYYTGSGNYITSGELVDTLVSGVNWDGKYTNSTVHGVHTTNTNAYDVTASGVTISGVVGYTACYHPSNDFNYDGTIDVLISGSNANTVAPVYYDRTYRLYYGYNIKNFDAEFSAGTNIPVSVTANNVDRNINTLHYSFYFTTIDKSSKNLSASITGIAPWEDITASISPQAPVHRYGESVTIEIYVEDFDGNALGPYTFTYTVENS